ncbi:MAG: VWA domain-containing protein [Candidatus Acetothermia bacterium]|jgi:cob(I)alamin adenosyltransferase|nr:VWA domain-containing protein [Candidatus Acetothermia bacterium]MDH7505420.1 VWA domain-containing protein [Candidatus Acetothermia bacterium]
MNEKRILMALLVVFLGMAAFLVYKGAVTPTARDISQLYEKYLEEVRATSETIASLREEVDRLASRTESSESAVKELQLSFDGSLASFAHLGDKLEAMLTVMEDQSAQPEQLLELTEIRRELESIKAELADPNYGLARVTADISTLEARVERVEVSGEKLWNCLNGMTLVLQDRPAEVERLPLDVILAIDSSGSMRVNDPGRLRITTARKFVEQLDPSRDRAGIVSWDNDIDFVQPLTNDLALVGKRLSQIDADGATNLNVGLSAAIAELLQHGRAEAKTVIIFLTDGDGAYIFSGEANSPLAPASGKEVKIYAIGLGREPSELKLQDMAGTTGGRIYLAPTAADLLEIYEELSKRLVAPAEQVFKITCPAD